MVKILLHIRILPKFDVDIKGKGSNIPTLNISAFNLGVAIGASVGGRVVDTSSLGLNATPWIGAIIVLVGAGLTVLSYRQNKTHTTI
ncbi:hypothetical protein [Chitinophaga polysaccharea]|uniref:hypothetical protein n=1 Tax=Chitinophaga polysaccharea TaxID=1293035 RepID=UPI001C9620E8|nr:hypothetical protein [Chitinophaga polysaccharea]